MKKLYFEIKKTYLIKFYVNCLKICPAKMCSQNITESSISRNEFQLINIEQNILFLAVQNLIQKNSFIDEQKVLQRSKEFNVNIFALMFH